ncbi:MAG: benzoate-CoA ligase family protein [Gammaproteobacteria bacterium]|nr:benzoate-CoA ligase family protein [Gammaproteobacteria bacterium]
MDDHSVAISEVGEVPELIFGSVFNAAVAFIDRHVAEGRGGKVAIRSDSADVSYAELAERTNRCARVFRDLGVRGGERVIMVIKDRPEFFYVFWGAIKAGAVPVPINTLLRSDDYRFILEDSGCTAVIYSPDLAEPVEVALAGLDNGPKHALTAYGKGSIVDRMQEAPDTIDAAPAAPGDDCFWLYSSGSTGHPKGVVHAHKDMVYTSELYAHRVLGVSESDTCFSAGKLFFSYGFGNAMTFPLWVGATTVLSEDRPAPDMTFAVIERFRPTIFFGVPTLYAQQLHAMETCEVDLSSVEKWASAGEALPADVYRRWKEKTGIGILDGIGSTEALHIFISNRHDDTRPGSSGRPVPGYAHRIVGEDGRPVAQGDVGQLHVKGGSTAKHYWNNPDKTAESMLGDWLNTGDMYYQDEDGYYVNYGRGDDMLKVGGMWCSPFEIESRLIEHPKVLEAAAVGRADDEGLIKPEAHVVLNDPADAGAALEQELRAHCKEGLAHYKYPRWFRFVDELPKTATGKIQRFRLRAGT